MLSILLCLASLLISASADGYVCAGQRMINPPDGNVYYWPENWKEGDPPAKYAGMQDCEWQINVLPGMYAKVIFYKDTDMESGITTTYPNGQQQYIEDKEHNPYIFTYPQFKVNLRVSDKQGLFSFVVIWSKYPGACQWNNDLADDGALAMVPNQCVTTFSSNNQVMLVGFSLRDDLDVLLRQSAIYEGDTVNGTYLGNLYYLRYNQIVSKNKKLTVFTWGLDKNFNYTLYMGLTTKAAGDVQQFTGLNCPSDTTKQCYVTLDAYTNITAVATIGRQPDYVKQFFSFPSGSTLKVYEGIVSDKTLLATINHSNYMNQLPLGVKNSLKIYHLDTGRVVLPITNNAVNAQWPIVYDGRYVNIQSFDYQATSYFQDTLEVFKTTNNYEKLYFNFKVNQVDWNTNTTLTVSVARDGKNVFSQIFTASNPPPVSTLKLFGDQMTVDYNTYGYYTKGFQIDLNTVKNENVLSSSSTILPIITSTLHSTLTPSSIHPLNFTSPSVNFTTIIPPVNPSGTTATGTTNREVSTTVHNVETTTKGSAHNFSLFLIISLNFFFF